MPDKNKDIMKNSLTNFENNCFKYGLLLSFILTSRQTVGSKTTIGFLEITSIGNNFVVFIIDRSLSSSSLSGVVSDRFETGRLGLIVMALSHSTEPVYREKGTRTKMGGGSLQHYLHPLNLGGRSPYQFPTLLNT